MSSQLAQATHNLVMDLVTIMYATAIYLFQICQRQENRRVLANTILMRTNFVLPNVLIDIRVKGDKMIELIMCLLAVAHPPDAVVDSLIRDFYEQGWFAERYDVDYVEFIHIANISIYGKYTYQIMENDEELQVDGYAYTITFGYYDREGYYYTKHLDCFIFYQHKRTNEWQMENVPFLPLVDPRTSPHREKGQKI